MSSHSSDTPASTRNEHTQPSSAHQEPVSAKLIELKHPDRGITRDINRKIEELEKQHQLLGKIFDSSQKMLDATLASQEERLTGAVSALKDSFSFSADALSTHEKQLERLRRGQDMLEGLQRQLTHSTEHQRVELQELANTVLNGFEQHQQQLQDISHEQGEHQTMLAELNTHYQALRDTALDHDHQLDTVRESVTALDKKTGKRFGVMAAAGAVTLLIIGGTLGYLQFHPDAIPAGTEQRLVQMQQTASELGAISAQASDDLEVLNSRTASVEASAVNNAGQLQALGTNQQQTQQALIATQADVNALRDSLASFETKVDNLDFRISGPSNRGAGLSEPTLPLNTTEWLQSQNTGHYTIQLVGVYQFQSLINYINQNDQVLDQQPLAYNQGTLAQRNWFNLFYGSYDSFDAAQAALEGLPMRLKTNSPWIRQFGSIVSANR